MKVLGLIVEYNPFHNGHLYHIEQSKKISGAEYVICVMSGNFIQRGEPAIINKWARAKSALYSGVDLVIELPVPYAISSAESFAYGAVKILNDIGIVDFLCFGSENGSVKDLNLIASILFNEPDSYKSLLKNELKKGISFPASREQALIKYLSSNNTDCLNLIEILSNSNNILGIEYLKALKRLNSSISPLTIKRVNNSYNTEHLTGSISSATAIRKNIYNSSDNFSENDLSSVLPEISKSIIHQEFLSGRGPVVASDFYNIITSFIRRITPQQIKDIAHVKEGLENRIKNAAAKSGTYNELLQNICTKRYTVTRIQRILMNILVGITSNDLNMFNIYNGPQYARILGFNQRGKYLLSLAKKNTSIPLILKTSDFISSCNPLLKRMLELECISTDMYVLGYKNPNYKKSGQEFTQNIIKI
ncbi:UNVERIFIED_CONTAM: putative nucleotidyltransferase [Acetivibrio alkalicellulosi]